MRGRKPDLPEMVDPPKSRCPAPPKWLAPHAKAEWKRAAPELHRRHLLQQDTLATLESYCTAIAQVRETEEIMIAEGRTVMTDSGPKRHPAFSIQSSAMREARLLAAELGLTPQRRGKQQVDDGGAGDGWDDDLLA